MLSTSAKTFRSISLHVNPKQPGDDEEIVPWFCDLSLLSSTETPTAIYAIGLDDPLIDRFLYCTSISVGIKRPLINSNNEKAVLRQSSSVGTFLHQLSLVATADSPLQALMTEDEDSDSEALVLMMYFDIESILSPIAMSAGIINKWEEIENICLRFQFSRTARAAHVASLALMMASHSRLGNGSAIGRMLGCDALRSICDAYRLRLYECRLCVWDD